eukprot:4646224-Pyramimonas_sp.AAC.1
MPSPPSPPGRSPLGAENDSTEQRALTEVSWSQRSHLGCAVGALDGVSGTSGSPKDFQRVARSSLSNNSRALSSRFLEGRGLER